jgi:hypothetical protein
MTTARYTDHLGDLIALTTYLALTPKISRTPVWLARDLSLAEQSVRETLNGFQSRRTRRRAVRLSSGIGARLLG